MNRNDDEGKSDEEDESEEESIDNENDEETLVELRRQADAGFPDFHLDGTDQWHCHHCDVNLERASLMVQHLKECHAEVAHWNYPKHAGQESENEED